ncbi:MAG: hypothetical protein JWO95_659 [Verrucomicrobiales bacterium]|nr:hypothetical protein [Verrucomicrobiales bacterium]
METKSREFGQMADEAKEQAQDFTQRAKAAGTAAWERAKSTYGTASDKAVHGAKVTDRAIRENPYQSLGIAFAAGLLFGFLIKGRRD